MHMGKKFFSVLAGLLLAALLCPCAAWAEEPVTVTIFTTNDIHGVVEGEGTVGIVQAAAMKASTQNALLIDAGDATQGASFATVSEGLDVIRMMNAAGYDAMAAGNHEFDYGADRLLANAAAAEFPILSANVTRDGAPLLTANTVVETGGKSIGLIGLTTANTATSTNPAKLTGVDFGDEITAAKAQIAALGDTVDTIVLICHLGDNNLAAAVTSEQLLDGLEDDELKKVAAVIDGHSHTVETEPYVRGDCTVPVVQTGTQFTAIGKIDLAFDAAGTVTAAVGVLDADEAKEYPLNEAGQTAAAAVQAALDAVKAEQAEILEQPLCTNNVPLWGGNIYWDYSEPRVVETSYGDFVTDAFAASARAFNEKNGYDLPVVAVENGGGISAALPVGQVTRGDVLGAFNHGNTVEVLTVTPAQLRAALEKGLVVTGQDDTGLLLRERVSGSFLQVSGFSYTYDPAAPSGQKVTAMALADGTPLGLDDTASTLLLATNNYVATTFTGDGGVGGEKAGELGGEDQIVMDYLLALTDGGSKPLAYDAGGERIHIANDRSPETYTVAIPVLLAPDGEAAQPNVVAHLSVDGGAAQEMATDADGNLVLTVPRGPHTFCLAEATDGQPVYTNNYSGSGTVTTKAGYYRLGFLAAQLPAAAGEQTPGSDPQPQPTPEAPQPTPEAPQPTPEVPQPTPEAPQPAPVVTPQPVDPSDIPQTGDAMPVALLFVLAGFAGAGLLVCRARAKRQQIRR